MWQRLFQKVSPAGSSFTTVRLTAKAGYGNMSQVLTVVPNVTYTLAYDLGIDASATDNETNTNYWRTTVGGQMVDELIGVPATPQDFVLNRRPTYRVPPQTTQVLLQFTFRSVCPAPFILLYAVQCIMCCSAQNTYEHFWFDVPKWAIISGRSWGCSCRLLVQISGPLLIWTSQTAPAKLGCIGYCCR